MYRDIVTETRLGYEWLGISALTLSIQRDPSKNTDSFLTTMKEDGWEYVGGAYRRKLPLTVQ